MTLLEATLSLSTLRLHHVRGTAQNIMLFVREYLRQSAQFTAVIPTHFSNLTLTERRFWTLAMLTAAAVGFFGFLRLVSFLSMPPLGD